jgi:IS5 family transposase
MLGTTPPSLWEAILPDACLGLPAELARVDRLLDDPVFLAPLVAHFEPHLGRPSIPLDTYLRIMSSRFRHRLGYELLCREVQDSIRWQRFVASACAPRCGARPLWSSSPAAWASRPSPG